METHQYRFRKKEYVQRGGKNVTGHRTTKLSVTVRAKIIVREKTDFILTFLEILINSNTIVVLTSHGNPLLHFAIG